MHYIAKAVRYFFISVGFAAIMYVSHATRPVEASHFNPEIRQTKLSTQTTEPCYDACTTSSQFSELRSLATFSLLDNSTSEQPPAGVMTVLASGASVIGLLIIFYRVPIRASIRYAEFGLRRE